MEKWQTRYGWHRIAVHFYMIIFGNFFFISYLGIDLSGMLKSTIISGTMIILKGLMGLDFRYVI